jgi:hypothetical protein
MKNIVTLFWEGRKLKKYFQRSQIPILNTVTTEKIIGEGTRIEE